MQEFCGEINIFQCRNGHTACSACCKRITGVARGCPSCSRPLGVIRNLAIEKVIESLQVDCKHALHGCNTKLKYTNREEIESHENESCVHRPVLCPLQTPSKCLHIGSKVTMPSHMAKEHGISIVECFGSGRSASFTMTASCPLTVLRTDYKPWVMVNCGKAPLTHPGSDVFCRVLEGSKLKVAHKLSVKGIRLKNEEKIFFTFTCMQAQAQTHRYLDVENNSVLDTMGSYRALHIPHEENERSELEFDLKVTFL